MKIIFRKKHEGITSEEGIALYYYLNSLIKTNDVIELIFEENVLVLPPFIRESLYYFVKEGEKAKNQINVKLTFKDKQTEEYVYDVIKRIKIENEKYYDSIDNF